MFQNPLEKKISNITSQNQYTLQFITFFKRQVKHK